MQLNQIAFYLLSAGAIVFGLLTVTRKSAVVSALMLVMTFCFLGAIYLTLNAQFLAVVQVAVYAGAIMVLVLFVIMLLNLEHEDFKLGRNWKSMVGILAALGVLGQILAVIFMSQDKLPQHLSQNAAALGTTEGVGMVLYSSYSFPFEMASLILISAAVGAIILAKKRIS
jgi:NADH-quinone oxidoreductase subunit J